MSYFLRRLAYLVAVLLAVTFLVSAMIDFLPGDPALVIVGENATPAQIAVVHKQLHLDQPVARRYVSWLGHAVRGDLGRSVTTSESISHTIGQKLPVTLELVILSQLVALLFALVTALYSAYKPRGVVDGATTVLSFAMISTPQFVLGIVLILFVSVKLGWFPVAGFTPLNHNLWQNLRSVALPVVAISADPAGVYQRLLRSDIGRTLREDYITMAQAKGLSPARILVRHGLRPSMFSTTTLAGITTARLIGGSVIMETIFAIPGIGRYLIDSINHHDLVAIQGVVAVIAVGYVVINTAVDLLYGVLDPRVRSS
jgi:peptide/nickel transport system permease protein